MKRLLLVFAGLSLLLSAQGCGTNKYYDPVTTVQAQKGPSTSLQGKSFAVLGMSLNKIKSYTLEQHVERINAQQETAGKTKISGLGKTSAKLEIAYLAVDAQYPYIIADGLKKSGAKADHGDQLFPTALSAGDSDLSVPMRTVESEKENLAAKGYDYIIIVGVTNQVAADEKYIFKGSSLLPGVSNKESSLLYSRQIKIVPTKPGEGTQEFEKTFNISKKIETQVYAFQEGATADDRMAAVMNAGMQDEVLKLVEWIESLPLQGK